MIKKLFFYCFFVFIITPFQDLHSADFFEDINVMTEIEVLKEELQQIYPNTQLLCNQFITDVSTNYTTLNWAGEKRALQLIDRYPIILKTIALQGDLYIPKIKFLHFLLLHQIFFSTEEIAYFTQKIKCTLKRYDANTQKKVLLKNIPLLEEIIDLMFENADEGKKLKNFLRNPEETKNPIPRIYSHRSHSENSSQISALETTLNQYYPHSIHPIRDFMNDFAANDKNPHWEFLDIIPAHQIALKELCLQGELYLPKLKILNFMLEHKKEEPLLSEKEQINFVRKMIAHLHRSRRETLCNHAPFVWNLMLKACPQTPQDLKQIETLLEKKNPLSMHEEWAQKKSLTSQSQENKNDQSALSAFEDLEHHSFFTFEHLDSQLDFSDKHETKTYFLERTENIQEKTEKKEINTHFFQEDICYESEDDDGYFKRGLPYENEDIEI